MALAPRVCHQSYWEGKPYRTKLDLCFEGAIKDNLFQSAIEVFRIVVWFVHHVPNEKTTKTLYHWFFLGAKLSLDNFLAENMTRKKKNPLSSIGTFFRGTIMKDDERVWEKALRISLFKAPSPKERSKFRGQSLLKGISFIVPRCKGNLFLKENQFKMTALD